MAATAGVASRWRRSTRARVFSPRARRARFAAWMWPLAALASAPTASAQHYTFTVLAGDAGQTGSNDGVGAGARFNTPEGLALDQAGNVFVADTGNHTIRKVTALGVVTTIAGLAGTPGSADGLGSSARFNSPRGIAVDREGTTYVADSGNHTVRKISPDGMVTTVVGLAGAPGSADGAGSSARFNRPWGLAIGEDGTVYVADRDNFTIRAVTHPGVVTTLAGAPGVSGAVDGTGAAARFAFPGGVAMQGTVVLVADAWGKVREVTRAGQVTTKMTVLSGGTYCIPNCPGPGMNGCGVGCSLTWWCTPQGPTVAVDAEGRLYLPTSLQLGAGGPCGLIVAMPSGARRTPVGLPNRASAAAANAARTLYVADGTTIGVGIFDPDGDRDGLPDDWEQQYGLSITSADGDEGGSGDPDGDGQTNAQELVAGSHPRGMFTQHFAEGATIPPFDTRFAVGGELFAKACFRFEDRAGVVTTRPVELSGRPVTVSPDAVGLAPSEFSTTVESDLPVVVDRTMSWPRDAEAYGAHMETGIEAPSPTWYLAEGATHSGFDLFYLVQNPSDVGVPIEVRYLRPPPSSPLVKSYDVPPHSRFNIWVNQEDPQLAATDVSAVITSTSGTPIIVERAMYLSRAGRPFDAGHESAGVTAPATRWFVAEGATGDFFDLFVLLANPGLEDADVEVTFLLPGGASVVQSHTVPASSRHTIWVDRAGAQLSSTPVSTLVASTNGVPIIVERAMWWPDGDWYESHNSPGTTSTGTVWQFAEGAVDRARNLDTYVLIANTSEATAFVSVTLTFEDGTGADRGIEVAPRSRENVSIGSMFPEAAGRRFAATVWSHSAWDQPPAQIVVEHATYWDADGQAWAAGASALARRKP